MKPAYRTVYYLIYPPNYVPGMGYKIAKSKKGADKLAKEPGSEIHRILERENRKGRGSMRCIMIFTKAPYV